MNEKINLFWTGGWDSTFRLLDIILVKEKKVQPYYIIDENRTSLEIETIEKIKRLVLKRKEKAKSLLLPTEFAHRKGLKPNPLISEKFNRLKRVMNLGTQYEWLAQFAAEREFNDLELCWVANGIMHLKLHENFEKIITQDDSYYILKSNLSNKDLSLFRYFRFPTLSVSKIDMYNIAAKEGFLDIMEQTWFCHHPTSSKLPCGVCIPCRLTIEQGLSKRIPKKSLIKYYIYRPFFPIKQFIMENK